jgi:hypothetical protein
VTEHGALFKSLVWYTLPVALLLTAVQWLTTAKKPAKPRAYGRLGIAAVAVVLIGSAGVSSYLTVRWHTWSTYGIAETTQDMCQVLGEGAIVSGQYGQMLVADCAIPSVPFYAEGAGATELDARGLAALCRDYPITHLAVTKPYWEDMAIRYDRLQAVSIICRYFVRDQIVFVVRVNDVFGNARAGRYKLSDFERALSLRDAGRIAESRALLREFRKDHPTCKAALLDEYYLAMYMDGLQAATETIDRLVDLYPTDFSLHMTAAVHYRELARQTRHARLEEKAQEHLRIAISYLPSNEGPLSQAYESLAPSVRVL